MTYSGTEKGTKEGTETIYEIDDPKLTSFIGQDAQEKLEEEIELLDGASAAFDQEKVSKGELSPVFFGSAELFPGDDDAAACPRGGLRHD